MIKRISKFLSKKCLPHVDGINGGKVRQTLETDNGWGIHFVVF